MERYVGTHTYIGSLADNSFDAWYLHEGQLTTKNRTILSKLIGSII